jgi:hypothetical protein
MADRNVPTTATIETFRTTYNLSAVDIGPIADLNNTFSGTPTNLVEGVNAASSKGFTIAMAVALG